MALRFLFHAGVLFQKAVELLTDAVQDWILGVPLEESDVWIVRANATKADIVKLLDSDWRSIPQILPEQNIKTMEALLQSLLVVCSSAKDALYF